jgi:hypothetical protein
VILTLDAAAVVGFVKSRRILGRRDLTRRVHPPTAHTPIPPNQKIDFSHTVYNTNN